MFPGFVEAAIAAGFGFVVPPKTAKNPRVPHAGFSLRDLATPIQVFPQLIASDSSRYLY
jgi:hypothetical protein